jgi:hypothetical protein
MTDRNPYALPRPYHAGYSRKQDERLAEQLFYGITVRNEKTGRLRHKFLSNNSPQERQGFEALERLLFFSCQDLAPSILIALLSTLDPSGGVGGRLVFKRRKRGKRDTAADFQIDFEVEHLKNYKRWKPEAAVKSVGDKFGLQRSAVFEAIARNRKRLKSLESG